MIEERRVWKESIRIHVQRMERGSQGWKRKWRSRATMEGLRAHRSKAAGMRERRREEYESMGRRTTYTRVEEVKRKRTEEEWKGMVAGIGRTKPEKKGSGSERCAGVR